MFDPNLTFCEIFSGPLEGVEKYFDYGNARTAERAHAMTMADFARMHPVCNRASMAEGLEFLRRSGESGGTVKALYAPEECLADPRKADVKLFCFPADNPAPAVIICAGGGFKYVCNIAEGFPVARTFSAIGYSVFVLNYRVGGSPALPSALHDLARAVKYINDNAKALNVIAGSYAVCGFSAGGTLAAQWGTDNKGYARYGLPKPAALFPIYPVLCLPEFYSKLRFKAYFGRAFGPDPLPATFDDYDLTRHMTVYPPAFMVIGRRDGLISYKPVSAFADLLLKRGVPAYADICPSSPHGFGDGEGRGAQGWILRADAFLKNGKV